MIRKEILIGIALLMLFSMTSNAYAADNSNDGSNHDIPVPPGFQRLSDVSFFNNGNENSTTAIDQIQLSDSQFKEIPVPPGFQRTTDINLINNSKDISNSAIDQILVPDGFINSVKNLGPNITQFPQNITANLVPILSSGGAKDLSNQPQNLRNEIKPITIQSLGDATITGNASIMWKQSIDGNRIIDYVVVPDLDGDGFKDMLAIIYDYDPYTGEYEYTLIAKKGSNGVQLLSQSINGRYAYIGLYGLVDLDGDHLNDLLIKTRNYDPETGTYTSTLIAKKGSNGVTLWSQTITGTSVDLYGYTVSDLDGDGLNDALVTAQEYDSATRIYTYSLIVKKGSNGENLWTQSINGTSLYLYGYAAGNLDSDGLNDVFVYSQKYDSATGIFTTSLKAKKGSNGENLWTQSINSVFSLPQIVVNFPGDLDGDGLGDVLATTRTYNPTTYIYAYKLMAKKGSTGANLWTQSINGTSVYLYGNTIGNLDRDGFNDVLVYTRKYDSATGMWTYSLKAKKGSNGETLWTQSNSGISSITYLYGYLVGNLDSDGLNDVLVNTRKYDSSTGIYTYAWIAKKGSNGATLWTQSISGASSSNIMIEPIAIGDLDGDGNGDVLIETGIYNPTTYTYAYKLMAKKGSTGVNLWTQSNSGASSITYLFGYLAGNLDSDGLNDVLVYTRKYDSNTGIYTYAWIAKKGSNGATLWTQSITGTSSSIIKIEPIAIVDLDGDGNRDVLVTTRKYNLTTYASAYKLIAKKGSTGANLWTQSITGTSVSLSGYTFNDLDGDGLRDVVVQTQKYDSATRKNKYTAIAKRGSTGVNLWSHSISGSSLWLNVIPAGDLSGDGIRDVLVNIGKYNSTTGSYTNYLIAQKGKDSTHLWKASANTWMFISRNYGYFGNYTNDLNGDGIDEVLFGTFRKIYAVKTRI